MKKKMLLGSCVLGFFVFWGMLLGCASNPVLRDNPTAADFGKYPQKIDRRLIGEWRDRKEGIIDYVFRTDGTGTYNRYSLDKIQIGYRWLIQDGRLEETWDFIFRTSGNNRIIIHNTEDDTYIERYYRCYPAHELFYIYLSRDAYKKPGDELEFIPGAIAPIIAEAKQNFEQARQEAEQAEQLREQQVAEMAILEIEGLIKVTIIGSRRGQSYTLPGGWTSYYDEIQEISTFTKRVNPGLQSIMFECFGQNSRYTEGQRLGVITVMAVFKPRARYKITATNNVPARTLSIFFTNVDDPNDVQKVDHRY